MLLSVVRHGDPIYDPDSLTERGKLQAQAAAKRLSLYGVDRIYSSPLIRAQQTARPTADLTGKEIVLQDWMSEALAWEDFSVPCGDDHRWIFAVEENRWKFHSPEILSLGYEWYEHPFFENTRCKEGYQRLLDASDRFFSELGYPHDRENHCYLEKEPNDLRVAVFCHQGFGLSWLGTLLDLPLPIIWSGFDISHSNITVVEFSAGENKICIPRALTFSNDSHLYREGLPTKYNNRIYF